MPLKPAEPPLVLRKPNFPEFPLLRKCPNFRKRCRQNSLAPNALSRLAVRRRRTRRYCRYCAPLDVSKCFGAARGGRLVLALATQQTAPISAQFPPNPPTFPEFPLPRKCPSSRKRCRQNSLSLTRCHRWPRARCAAASAPTALQHWTTAGPPAAYQLSEN